MAISFAGKQTNESGFVLVTALIMLSLLTMLSLGMFLTSRTATQTSGTAQTTTEAYYYAETAVNYITWALANDAEFDNFTYTGAYIHGAFSAPPLHPDAPDTEAAYGDYMELMGWDLGAQVGIPADPGPTSISDSGTGIVGQVMYFDNTPMKDRYLCFEDMDVFDNCIDVTVDPANRVAPSMYQIHVNLPRYIKLTIAADGTITPSIPQLPHRAPTSSEDRVGEDIPKNGAIVWITAGDPNNPDRDIEIFPVDPAAIGTGAPAATACSGEKMPANCPCDGATFAGEWYACDAHANANVDPAIPVVNGAYDTADSGVTNVGAWVPNYSVVAYAIGYVNGKASHLIRAVIR
ncbi:MAG: hypothetical protein AUJ57_09950 [Zetaproteobacteria bacterium CG1_02_53_45]|nr:MAG: hypothetical protein AUJ57_09950 [Zetaproteobacteria bacterium CG1_02_53_45]